MSIKKIILSIIFFFGLILIGNYSKATTISVNPQNPKVGDTVTVTITVPNVHTSTVTANVTGVVSGTIKVVGGDMAGNPSTYSNSASYYCSQEGTINVAITSNSSAVLNGTYVDVSASTSIKVNATNSSGESTSSSSSSTGTTSSSSTSSGKSSNANLTNLGIRPNDFTGFKPGTTTYNVTVPEDVESVEVYATASDSKATISGTGRKTLQNGANALNVVVTAEDGTTKTYTINVTREGTQEEQEEEETSEEEITEVKNGLSNITIGDLELSPSFKTDVYEYTVKYIGEDTSLDIQTVATDPSYTVEILGNEELQEGENIITILVSDSEGNNVATYQITVNKSLVDEEALAKEEEERQKQEQMRMLAIAGGIVALIVIIIIIIVIKRRRNRTYAEEFSGVPFARINDEDGYDNNYDNYNNYGNDNQFDNYDDEPVNETHNDSYDNSENEALPEEISQEENQETSSKLELYESEEQREKEKAKRDFLEGYNSDYMDEYEEDKPRKGRKKGKRFK